MNLARRAFLKMTSVLLTIGSTASLAEGSSYLHGIAGEALLQPKEYPWKWWVSSDEGEVYHTQCESYSEALKVAQDHGGGLIAECRRQDFDTRVRGDDMLELIDGQNEDLMGEDGTGIECTAEQTMELGRMVSATIEAWAQKNKIDLAAFQFGGVRNKTVIKLLGDGAIKGSVAANPDQAAGPIWIAAHEPQDLI